MLIVGSPLLGFPTSTRKEREREAGKIERVSCCSRRPVRSRVAATVIIVIVPPNLPTGREVDVRARPQGRRRKKEERRGGETTHAEARPRERASSSAHAPTVVLLLVRIVAYLSPETCSCANISATAPRPLPSS